MILAVKTSYVKGEFTTSRSTIKHVDVLGGGAATRSVLSCAMNRGIDKEMRELPTLPDQFSIVEYKQPAARDRLPRVPLKGRYIAEWPRAKGADMSPLCHKQTLRGTVRVYKHECTVIDSDIELVVSRKNFYSVAQGIEAGMQEVHVCRCMY